MVEVKCTRHSKTCFNLFSKDKNLHMNVAKQSGGRWSSKSGWIIPYENQGMFEKLFSIVFPNYVLEIEPVMVEKVVEPDVVEKVVEPDVVEKVVEPDVVEKVVEPGKNYKPKKNKYRRSRSAEKGDGKGKEYRKFIKDSKKAPEREPRSAIEYYESFKQSTDKFKGKLYDSADELELSTSDSESGDSDSSDDYPASSPTRKNIINDKTFDKMKALNSRMSELSKKDRKRR